MLLYLLGVLHAVSLVPDTLALHTVQCAALTAGGAPAGFGGWLLGLCLEPLVVPSSMEMEAVFTISCMNRKHDHFTVLQTSFFPIVTNC